MSESAQGSSDTVSDSGVVLVDAKQLDDLEAAARERDQLRAERDDFMEWLTDQQVVHWTLTNETKDNPKAAVKSLLQTFLREMEDPQISEIAAKAAELDAALSRLAAAEVDAASWYEQCEDARTLALRLGTEKVAAEEQLVIWKNLRPGWDIAEVDKALQDGDAAHRLWQAAEERERVLREVLGKYVVAMHILQHANDVDWESCEKGMCPKMRPLLTPAEEE